MSTSNAAPPSLDSALACMRAKDYVKAEQQLSELLARDPDNVDVMGWLALASYEGGRGERAIGLWQRVLASQPRPSFHLATLHNLLQAVVAKHGMERAKACVGEYSIPDWPVERIPNDYVSAELIKFTDLLVELGQADAAERLLNNLLVSRPRHGGFLLALARSKMATKKLDEAWETLQAAEAALPDNAQISLLGAMYQCARMRSDEQAANNIRDRACRREPIYIYPSHPNQKGRILILNRAPSLDRNTSSVSQLHAGDNFPNQLPKRLGEDFLFASIFVMDEASRLAGLEFAPDLVINNYTNGELLNAGDHLEVVSAFADSFDVPVLNHPGKAVQTTRERSIDLLSGISGLRLPRTIRFDKTTYSLEQMVEAVEAAVPYPLITRHVSFQVGKGMTKVDDRAGLIDALAHETGREFLVTKFIDTRGDREFYRKIRVASINGEIHFIRVDYNQGWNVHRPKSLDEAAPLLDNKFLVSEMERICANPEEALGPVAVSVIKEISKCYPLDIFGIDFDVAEDGEVVFYEANGMMLFLDPHSGWEYPKAAEDRLLASMRSYFMDRIEYGHS